MEALCLRSVDHFHLTYDETERSYKIKAIPTDGKHLYFRSRVDEVFCMVPKLLRSTYVKRLAFGHVVLSDSLCKSIRDIVHTVRIDELELGGFYANGFVDEHLSSPKLFFKMLEGFQHLRSLRVNEFKSARAFFRDPFLEHVRGIQRIYLRGSAFTEQAIINYYFFDDKPHATGQVCSLGIDITERFVISFAQAAANSAHRLFPFELRTFHASRQQIAGSHSHLAAWQKATVDEANGRLWLNSSSLYKLPLGEKAALFCAVDEENQRGSNADETLSTIFTLEVCDD
ncbi:hypothetical protein AAVH_25012 [Aphelenchoides avenae]|nr:hypothetical protein AAVH_25012 [Aphelenchus avenae]